MGIHENNGVNMKIKNTIFLIVSTLLLFIPAVLATTNTTISSSIMGKTAFGLLIDLHLQDWFPADQAIMYYNYISIFIIMVWAAFASQSNESRYAFTTPFIAALMVFIGWLQASNVTDYWSLIVFCLLLGAFMYLNDMNHEKYGLPGPGDKLLAATFLIMCFSASFGLISSSSFGLFPTDQQTGTSSNVMCGTTYTCDSSGNVALDASVSSVSGTGGLSLDPISIAYTLTMIAVGILKLMIVIAGSVLFFSVVILAAYPALSDSAAAVAFLGIMQLVIWAIYYKAFFNWYYKPMPGTGDI